MVPKTLQENDQQESLPRVRDDELDFDENLTYYHRGTKFTGIGYEEDPVHGLSEITYQDGRQSGPARDWFPSGQLKGESTYHNNMLNGISREFREDGSLISESYYDRGVKVSSVSYDNDGKIISRYKIAQNDPSYAAVEKFRNPPGTSQG